MFYDTFTPKFDDQGRFLLPADFRPQLRDGMVITRAPDSECLEIWPAAKFEADMIAATKDMSVRKSREYQQKIASMGSGKSADGQGRVTIPPKLREFAGIEKDITVVGAFNHVEVWDTPKWEEHFAAISSEKKSRKNKKRKDEEPGG